MVRKGPTRRKRGDIWAQLGVSACVLLLPPFVMAAGVMYLGSSPSQGTSQSAAQQAVAPDASVTKPVSMADRSDMRPDAGTSFALASARQQAAVTEQRPAAAQSPVAVARPPAASAPPAPGAQRQVAAQAAAAQAATAQAAAAKDPARYSGLAPVTLVNAAKANTQSTVAEIEAPPPAAAAQDTKAPDTAAAVPEQTPAATRIRASRRWGRHEPRAAYRARQTRSFSDIFLRPTTRTR
jgi:hypothetical protein